MIIYKECKNFIVITKSKNVNNFQNGCSKKKESAKVLFREGNSPDRKLRFLKYNKCQKDK